MLQSWPHVQKEMISAGAESDMRKLIEVVTAIRNMRSVWNVEPRTEVDVITNTGSDKEEKLLSENLGLVKRMARVKDLKVGRNAKPKNAAASVVGGTEIYLPLEGLIDFEKEKARLKREEARLEAEHRSLSGRLKNKEFLSKAPGDVVAGQKARRSEVGEQIKKLRDNLREIGV
jgi:valyl-tRNA synthetase